MKNKNLFFIAYSKVIIILIICCLAACTKTGFTPASSSFLKEMPSVYDMYAGDAIECRDGGYAILTTASDSPRYLFYKCGIILTRTDINGAVSWQKIFHPSMATCGNKIFQTPDDGFVITGCVGKGNVHIPSEASPQLDTEIVMKTDKSGNLLQQNIIYVPSYISSPEPNVGICADPAGGYVLVSTDSSTYYTILKFDDLGNTVWYKIHNRKLSFNLISPTIAPSGDGGYIITGFAGTPRFAYAGYGAIDSGSKAFVIKTDNSGNEIWYKEYKTLQEDAAQGGLVMDDGSILVAGLTENFNAYTTGVTLFKFKQNGDSISKKVIINGQQNFPVVFPQNNVLYQYLVRCSDGNYVTMINNFFYGAHVKHPYLIKFDKDLNVLWQQEIPSGVLVRSIHPTSDNGFIISGNTYRFGYSFGFGSTLSKVVLIKLDADGNLR